MYYFAYGSNMSLEQMRRLCGWHCHFLGRAVLPDFEIGVGSRGYANIRSCLGSLVHGILFLIDEDGLNLLDNFEGFPDVFNRKEVVVKDELNVEYKANVYFETSTDFGVTKPQEEYFKRVILAAEQQKLPKDWVARLKSLAR